MNTSTTIPDYDRFTKSDNQLIAFESIVIVVLCVYILFQDRMARLERKETTETNKALAQALAILSEAVKRGK